MKKLLLCLWLVLGSVVAQAQTANGLINAASTDCSTANSCVTVAPNVPTSSVGVELTGTFAGTFQFEGTIGGSTWVAVNATPVASTTAVTSATAAGVWQIAAAGLTGVRVRCSTYSSGAANVALVASSGAAKRNSGGGAGTGDVVGPASATDGHLATFDGTTGKLIKDGGAALATPVTLANGGTGAALTASNGGIHYSTATVTAILAGTATAGQIIRSGASTAPTWSTATYPATGGTSGLALVSDGTNFVSTAVANSITGTANQVVASAATGAVTLSLPQSIATASTPQFAGLGIGAAAATNQLTHTQGSLTGASTPAYTHTATWNSGTTVMTDHFVNITDTASGSASLLTDLQVGGVTKFNVRKDGYVSGTGWLTTFNAAGNINASADIQLLFGSKLTWSSGPNILSSANNIITISNASSVTGFRFQTGLPTYSSACGTGRAVTAGSTDTVGSINVGTGGVANSCVIAFATTWASAPFCIVADNTNPTATTAATSTTLLTLTTAVAWAASDVITWICIGPRA